MSSSKKSEIGCLGWLWAATICMALILLGADPENSLMYFMAAVIVSLTLGPVMLVRQVVDRRKKQADWERRLANKAECDANGFNEDGIHWQTETEFDLKGYDQDGYDRSGRDRDGYDREGYDSEGWDRSGLGPDGYDSEGYDGDGLDRGGRDRYGRDSEGYDYEGYTRSGWSRHAVHRETRTHFGPDGLDIHGYRPAGNRGDALRDARKVISDELLIEIIKAMADVDQSGTWRSYAEQVADGVALDDVFNVGGDAPYSVGAHVLEPSVVRLTVWRVAGPLAGYGENILVKLDETGHVASTQLEDQLLS